MELNTAQSLRRQHPPAPRRSLAGLLAHLREQIEATRRADRERRERREFADPLDHPELRGMSARELADIPFARIALPADR